jgi:heat shock protein HslJ
MVLKKYLPVIAGASALLLAACSTTDNGGPETAPPASYQVEGATFKILSVNGKPALKNVDADIRFEGGRISGTAGCNRLNGGFTQSGNVLTISGVAVTMMACPPAEMAQERDSLAVLESGATVHRHSDGRVEIRGPKGGVLELSRKF